MGKPHIPLSEKDFAEIQDRIGIRFRNPRLLETAFIHRSYLNEIPKGNVVSNERMEFLGDAALEIAISQYLYRRYPKLPEGDLTSIRSTVVNTTALAHFAEESGMGTWLRLSRGEQNDFDRGARNRQRILACTLEAVIGAIYLDRGLEGVEFFLETRVYQSVHVVVTRKSYRDPKSTLQELCQQRFGITPTYDILESKGPDHDRKFTCAVFFAERQVAIGEGASKAEAQVDAARGALKSEFQIVLEEGVALP